jgi:alkylhydroperoxidase family enzyme
MRLFVLSLTALLLGLAGRAFAQDPAKPKPVPITRDEMKEALDALKKREPRLPLPPATDEEKEKAKRDGRQLVNNGRMRAYYLGPDLYGESQRDPDPNMALDRTYKVMFFWIVCRANNCHYCQGHQEVGLTAAGVSEEKRAALDGDWSEFTPAEQAAFALVKKLTYEPHKITGADLDPVRKHYKDREVLEIILTVAGNNATNRWTDSLGIPQESHRVFLTPTADKYKDKASKVAPLAQDQPGKAPAIAAEVKRPSLEKREAVEKALAACRTREPRLPLVDEDEARKALPADWPKGALPQWVRLLANFPKTGTGRAVSLRAAEDKGILNKLLRAEVAWIAARHDRAWYALGHAKQRLKAQGLSEDAIYALDGPWEQYKPAEQAAFAFARKLTVTPAWITDDDIAGLRKHFKDKEVAELVYQITLTALFDRLTEAAGLRLEEN